MSQYTDFTLDQMLFNQNEIITLLKSIDEKLKFLCGPEYENKEKTNK